MTRDAEFKRRVRDVARSRGGSYSAARSKLLRASAETDAALVAAGVAPILKRWHSAPPARRRDITRSLPPAQGRLFAFWILQAHAADGLTGLCRSHWHRLSTEGDLWTLLERGLADHRAIQRVLAKLHARVRDAISRSDGGDAAWLDCLNPEVMRALDADFRRAMARSLNRVAGRVRAMPHLYAAVEVQP